jgi:hypothetical protein
MNLAEFRVYAVGDTPHPDRLKAELWQERLMGSFELQLLDAHRGCELDASVRCPPFRVFSSPPDTLKGGHRTRRFMESLEVAQPEAEEGWRVHKARI